MSPQLKPFVDRHFYESLALDEQMMDIIGQYEKIPDDTLRKKLIDVHNSVSSMNTNAYFVCPDRQFKKDRFSQKITIEENRFKILKNTFDKRLIVFENENSISSVPLGTKRVGGGLDRPSKVDIKRKANNSETDTEYRNKRVRRVSV